MRDPNPDTPRPPGHSARPGTISYSGRHYRVPDAYIGRRVWTRLKGDRLTIQVGTCSLTSLGRSEYYFATSHSMVHAELLALRTAYGGIVELTRSDLPGKGVSEANDLPVCFRRPG